MQDEQSGKYLKKFLKDFNFGKNNRHICHADNHNQLFSRTVC